MVFLSAMVLVASSVGQQTTPSLDTMLNDANYVFNRYEELVSRMPCARLKVTTLQQQCREIISTSQGNIRFGKAALGRASKAKAPSLIDIFDVYTEIQEAAGNLNTFSSEVNQFSDEDAMPYAETGAKADVLAAHLGVYVRARVILSCKEG
jgi:hypothetical protein